MYRLFLEIDKVHDLIQLQSQNYSFDEA